MALDGPLLLISWKGGRRIWLKIGFILILNGFIRRIWCKHRYKSRRKLKKHINVKRTNSRYKNRKLLIET